MKRLFFAFTASIILTLLFSLNTNAQSCANQNSSYSNYSKKDTYNERKRKQAIFVERNGNGLDWSLNYDTRFFAGRNSGPGIRIGVGGTNGTLNENTQTFEDITVPVELNILTGGGRFSFEFGAGGTGIYDSDLETWETIGMARAGIRLKPKRKGLVFRWALTPQITNEGIDLGYTGMSFGWGF